MRTLQFFFTAVWIAGAVFPSAAQRKSRQQPAAAVTVSPKKPLHHNVYDFWEEIPEQALSNDGKFLAYTLNPQQGDGFLYISRTNDGALVNKIARGSDVRFTNNSRYAVFKIKPEFEKTKEARRAKKKKEELPKDSLGLLSLETGELIKWPAVISWKIPEKGDGWIAWLSESEVKSDSVSKKPGKPKKENEDNGYRLSVRKLSGGTEQNYPFVKEYAFSKDGSQLAFASAGDGAEYNAGVLLWEQHVDQPRMLLPGHPKQSFRKITFDEAGEQLALIADPDTNSKTQIRYPKLYYWKKGSPEAVLKADENNQPGEAGWLVNSEYTPNFSKDGRTLYYGINPVPLVADTTLLPEEIVNVEVWHWKDPELQTRQKVTLKSDRNKAFLVALNLADGSSRQITKGRLQQASLINEGNSPYILVTDPSAYSHEHWDWNPKSDIHLVHKTTGAETVVQQKLEGNAGASPLGKYIYWFSNPDTSWIAYDVEKRTKIRLTSNDSVRYADEEDDHPDFPRSYGIAGWTQNDEEVIIYDRYDLWLVNPSNPQSKTRLTDGRPEKQRYRYVKLDPEERNIDLSKNLLFRSFNETTKKEGFYSYQHRDRKITRQYEGDFRIGLKVLKARDSDKLLFSRETFRDFPNWYLTDLSFKNPVQATQANRQQDEYSWGTVEIVKWFANDGTPLSGLLYKPDNFDPSKKYPLMTYFYEKNSDNLHTHFAPRPIRSYINFSYFTSNGYVVFVPDIVYQIGYPGHSAYNCVIPGVLNLLDKGFIDKDRIGVSGHSWGGYQAAYLITRTNLFRAAEAGAPVSNMTSAYGGVRWDSGLVRQAQYERTQSRIGGTLWEKHVQFIENSPLFFADRVQTPVLMMHNDEDGAVPWYQGIEFFLALKRLNKPVWMLNYNGEKHGLTKRQNMTDFAVRLYQFFDHYLKDAPAPRWLSEGLPYVEKGIRQGLEPTDSK